MFYILGWEVVFLHLVTLGWLIIYIIYMYVFKFIYFLDILLMSKGVINGRIYLSLKYGQFCVHAVYCSLLQYTV